VGSGATTNSSYPNPFYSNWSNTHNQYLIKASELSASGIPAGNITSMAFNITSGTTALKEFSVKIGHTTATNMSAFLSPVFTTVYSASTQTPVVGVNTLTFTTPFAWDGTSNLVIELCHGNSASTATVSSTCTADNTSYVSVIHVNKTVATAGSVVCGDNTSGLTTYSVRPRFTFGFSGCESPRTEVVATITAAPEISASSNPMSVCATMPATLAVSSSNSGYSYTWNPGNLPGATQTVYPETTTTYTVTASDPVTGCSTQGTTTVAVLLSPSSLTITPSAPVVAPGSVQQLDATGGTVAGATLFSETFNDATNTWTTVNTSTGGTPANADWTLRADGYLYNTTTYHSNDNTQFYMTNSDAQGSSGITHTQLISPVINTNGFTTLTLSFWHYFRYLDTDTQAKIDVSTDGGATWNATPVASYNSTQGDASAFIQATVDLTPYVGQSNFKFRFRYQDTYGWYWCIDNVRITGNAIPGFAWSPTTDLYLDAAATIPYTGESLSTVYTKPTATITYMATATASSTGCQRSANVTVTVQTPCGIPVDNTISAVTTTTATMSWTAPATVPGSGYEYEVRTSGAPGSGTTGLVISGSTPAGTTTANLSGLIPYTSYHTYVRSNCGDNIYSDWTADVTFTTLVEPLTVTGIAVNNTCAYSCDGSVTTTVTGGVSPYTYLWTDGSTNASPVSLCGGVYTVTVTDAVMVTTTGTWTVSEPAEITAVVDVTNLTCYGSNDGVIAIASVTGGTSPYSYTWSNGATSQNLSGLAAGFYSCTITDAHQCTYEFTRTVMQPLNLSLSTFVTDATCPGIADGTIELYINGGSYPYQVNWNTSATTQNLSGLLPGTYSVTVTDDNGCIQTGSWSVGVLNPICNTLAVAGVDSTVKCYNALNTIVVAGTPNTYLVKSGGDVTFIAGVKISFLPGTRVLAGGYMHGKIYTNQWCNEAKLTEVAAEAPDTPTVTEMMRFSIYPNPNNGHFTLVQKGEKVYDQVRVEFYSMNGHRLSTETITGQKHEFTMDDLPSGIYFMKVITNGYAETIKLVKTR
jgi:hypothetical protein